MAKSLKKFISESAIKKEVTTWEIKDCENYLDKHKKDKEINPDSLMAKKLNIVMEHQKILETIKFATERKGEQRAKLLKDVPFDLLIKNAPLEAQDPKNKKLRNYQKNTGVYLWSHGYDVSKFLGAGKNAVAWSKKNTKEVLRVACDRTYLGFIHLRKSISEWKNAKEMEKALGEHISEKNHILIYNTTDGKLNEESGKSVFTAKKAEYGDLENYSDKYDSKTAIQFLSDILKGIKTLHDKGYSHNDIKPANIMVSTKTTKDQKKRAAAYVADLGNVTKFDKSKKFVAPKLHAPDYNNTNKDAVRKRDVYSAGALTLFKLANIKNYKNYLSVTNYLVKKGSNKFYNKYLSKNLNQEESNNLCIKFLDIIQNMVQPNYKKRIDLETAITKVKKLKYDLKNRS